MANVQPVEAEPGPFLGMATRIRGRDAFDIQSFLPSFTLCLCMHGHTHRSTVEVRTTYSTGSLLPSYGSWEPTQTSRAALLSERLADLSFLLFTYH